jgi:carbohydrate-binding DOMON domain-containing protein
MERLRMTDLPITELAQGGAAVAVLCWVVWRAIDKLGERMEKRLDDLDTLLTKMVERLARIDTRTADAAEAGGSVTQVLDVGRRYPRTKTPVPRPKPITPFTEDDDTTPPDRRKP